MTLEQIKDNADIAETYPESGILNWGEISFETIAEWVRQNPRQESAFTEDFDVESVKSMFYEWWKSTSKNEDCKKKKISGTFFEEKQNKGCGIPCRECKRGMTCDIFNVK